MATLDRGVWNKPVPIIQRKAGGTLLVGNSVQAARILLQEWPATPGPKHRAARQAVLDAMEKALDQERQAKAREAFRAAAIEAGIARDLGSDEG
jgi:hypothetical protein